MSLAKLTHNNNHYPPGITYGGDPEIFLAQESGIIGAERVIPEAGITDGDYALGQLVLDGVQAELHPYASACRAGFTNSIRAILIELRKRLETHKGTSVSWSGVVDVPEEELKILSEKARVLGCEGSENAYGEGAKADLAAVNAAAYRTRSAGGHIHIGLPLAAHSADVQAAYDAAYKKWYHEYCVKGNYKPAPKYPPQKIDYDHYPPVEMAKAMDYLTGNTCVLLDRDPRAAERRKLYGRAGEYRTPPHGFEYRTLSNFWLRSVQLTSFVLGLARMTASVFYANGCYSPDYRKDLFSTVDPALVEKAINLNDADLALKNWEAIRPYIAEMFVETPDATQCGMYSGYSLDARLIPDFEFFLTRPITEWFSQDPLTHWTTLPADTHNNGWESFLIKTVRPMRVEKEQVAA